MSHFEKRTAIIEYVAPSVSLFPAKFALVFGTRHGVPMFVSEILSLYHKGYFEKVIVSGGATAPGAPSEASTISAALVQRGFPERVMILEHKAVNTGENVAFSRDLIGELKLEGLLLIGKVSSKRRYIMTVRKQWPEVRKICCHGVNYFSSPEALWWKDREFRCRVISEYRKIPIYIEKGFVSEVSIANGVVL
jgi:uncharacterized SAM-binding protein YcdF (DUF218 family)